ncbi:Lar family restriction alleviation protein [Burkholderia gladioli]|uniref:Lar family restriction alleviation protein n=1 Tax=Burkholderia gladioli TaxID=28095 RepID=UPI0016416078|nr:Lar family restriction alleviation protein [Burkholderia gladioli]
MSDKLSDCPFCGGPASSSQQTNGGRWAAYCLDCNAIVDGEFSESDAIAAWNRRASPAPAITMPPLNDAMRAVLTNENCIYGTPDELYAALVKAAPAISESEDAVALRAEVNRLNAIINTPQAGDFLRAVSIEAEHQRQRWSSEHDGGKTPADWFWLVGYLAGKALHAHAVCDEKKAEHHIITTAAALANWHLAIFGKTNMRPGIQPALDAARKGEKS